MGRCWLRGERVISIELSKFSSWQNKARDKMIKVLETVAQDVVIRLPVDVSSTAHCVVTILEDNLDTLREQSQLELPERQQLRMSELLRKLRFWRRIVLLQLGQGHTSHYFEKTLRNL